MISVVQFLLGPMDNFVYLITNTERKTCVVVDPAWDVPKLTEYMGEHGLSMEAVLLTHGHHDHINGLDELLDWKKVPVYLSEMEAPSLTPDMDMIRFSDGDTLHIGGMDIDCILTPGHTPGGACFKAGYNLITGDTLFIKGCGRCNFANSNVEHMFDSLAKLKSLDEEVIVYPGHHYGRAHTDTIGNLKQTNRYLRCDTKDEFIDLRMSV